MTKIIFYVKCPQDTQFVIASVIELEFPINHENKSRIIYLTIGNFKNQSVYEFNLSINGSDIKSYEDIESITLSQKRELCTKNNVIEDNYEYWRNIMMKRLEEIGQLRADRIIMLEKLDHYDSTHQDSKEDVSIQDVDLITRQINNHTIEINNICTQYIDVTYEEYVKLVHIDLKCGLLKRIELKKPAYIDQKMVKEELFDIVWFIQDYDDEVTYNIKPSRIDIIDIKNHTINISKIRKNDMTGITKK